MHIAMVSNRVDTLKVHVMDELYQVKGPKTIAEMTWVEVAEEIKQGAKTAILIVGANEQHGPHGPMFIDTMLPLEQARLAVMKLRKEGIRVLIAPPIPWAMSHHHLPFPGSMALRSTTLTNLIVDLCQSLIDSGIERIALVIGHGGAEQYGCVANARLEVIERFGVPVGIYNSPLTSEEKRQILKGPSPWSTAHGGEEETAQIMAIAPKLVDKSSLSKNVPKEAEAIYSVPSTLRYPVRQGGIRLRSGRYAVAPGPRDFTAGKGFAGDVTMATEETGRKLLEMHSDHMAAWIKVMIKESEKKYV